MFRWSVLLRVTLLGTLLVLQSGCSGHYVKFVPLIKCKIPPTDQATVLMGSVEEAKALWDKAQLPHNTLRQKYELTKAGYGALTRQLGSKDYLLIGEVYGGGNAWSTQATLTEAISRKAAQKGGHVVLILERGTICQPYTYTTPGYSTTNVNVSAYGYGNYATGWGTSHTTYHPSQTYSGVFYKPTASGLVFRHVPGAEARNEAVAALDDDALGQVLALQRTVAQDKRITLRDALRCIDEMIADE